jgi:hypothetical protein
MIAFLREAYRGFRVTQQPDAETGFLHQVSVRMQKPAQKPGFFGSVLLLLDFQVGEVFLNQAAVSTAAIRSSRIGVGCHWSFS